MTSVESPLERLAGLNPVERETVLTVFAQERGITVDELKATMLNSWRFTGRPKQQAPPGDWMFWWLRAGRGFGKESCVETPVPVPSGWKRLGDIEPGDLVFDESGRLCPVTATYDRMPEEAYRLRFSDGTHIDVGADHLWTTWDHRARKSYGRSEYETWGEMPPEWPAWRARRKVGGWKRHSSEVIEEALRLHAAGLSIRKTAERLGVYRTSLNVHLRAGRFVEREPISYDDSPGPAVRSTADIVETFTHGKRRDLNHSIPVCGALDLPKRELPLDPYILGAWLGDGSKNGGHLTAAPSDQPHWYEILQEFSPHATRDPITIATYGMTKILRQLGVLNNKHVPSEYLRASAEQRLALLQGLMDTDGSARASSVEFSNTNKGLVTAVTELARSLGQKPVIAEGRAMLNGKDCGPKWRVTWRPTVAPFRMERKATLIQPLGSQAFRNRHRMIVGWERIEPKPMRCLTVASRHSMFLIGEGMIPTHNTLSAAHWSKDRGLERRCRIGVIAPTLGDVRATCFEGVTGLLSVIPNDAFLGQSRSIGWNKSLLELTLANGTVFKGFSSEEPDRLRGPQHHYVWGEEVSSWKDAPKGDALDTTFSNMKLGLRLGEKPQAVLTSTPKANKLTKELAALADDLMVMVLGSSYENRANLSEQWWRAVVEPLEGTRTGRQEIEAEILEDVEGALWTRWLIDNGRVTEHPPLRRIIVGVDPNTTSGATADDAGIVVAGEGQSDKHAYVIADHTQTRGGPRAWARAAVDAYYEHEADLIVAEANNGGEMVKLTILAVDPTVPVKIVNASRGKRTRAEPVATLYGSLEPEKVEENPPRVHHVGVFPEMEDEMTTWTPENDSPNRMDALVWAVTELKIWEAPRTPMRTYVPGRDKSGVEVNIAPDRFGGSDGMFTGPL